MGGSLLAVARQRRAAVGGRSQVYQDEPGAEDVEDSQSGSLCPQKRVEAYCTRSVAFLDRHRRLDAFGVAFHLPRAAYAQDDGRAASAGDRSDGRKSAARDAASMRFSFARRERTGATLAAGAVRQVDQDCRAWSSAAL